MSQTGYYDVRPLAVFVRDPQTGEIIGGLHGRSEFGLVYVAWFFLPENWRGAGIGGRVLAMAAQESPRTTKLYDRKGDEITLDEVERINI